MFCSFLEPIGLRVPTGNLTDISMFTVGCLCRRYLSTRGVSVAKFFCRDLMQHERKMRSKPTEGKSNHNTRKKILLERRASEAWFSSYGVLKFAENAQINTLRFQVGMWGPTVFHHLRLELFCHDFLPNFLLELLQDVDLQPRIHLWFMRDGDAPHFLFSFRKFLSNVFRE